MRDLDLEHRTRAPLPQIHSFGQTAGKRMRLPRGFFAQMAELRVRARDIERRCEAVNQQVARLIRLDQPELHPVRARVEIEDPSAEFCLAADLCLAVEVRLAVDFHRRFEAHRGSPNIFPAGYKSPMR